MTATADRPARPATRPHDPLPEGGLSGLGLVMGRELRTRGRSRSYLVSTLISLVLLVGVIVVPTLLAGGTTHRLGVVGERSTDVAAVAEQLLAGDEETTLETTVLADVPAAEAAVRDGDVDAALLDGERVLVNRTGGFGGVSLVDLLQQAAGAQQLRGLLDVDEAAQAEAALTGRALDVVPLSGQDAAATEGRTWLAYGGALLMYLLIMQYGTWALNGVTEEKANRVIEILLSTAPPWQLFAGKLVGIAVLGLAQFIVLIAAALAAIRLTGAFELPALPVGFAGVLSLWVLLGFAVYLVLFGCAGALAAKMEDAQSAVSPIMTLGFIGFFASFAVLGNPDGLIGLVGTFVPFMAPFVVPIRAALETIPLWQHLLSVALTLATAAVLTLLAGRVYRGGALQFAGKVGWRKALHHRD